MLFTENTFRTINNKKNVAVKSALQTFESTVECSGLSIKLPINGTESYLIDNTEYTIRPGSFLLVNEGQQLTCVLDSPEVVESICLYLDGGTYGEIIQRYANGASLDSIGHQHNEVLVDKYYMTDCGLSQFLTSITRLTDLTALTEEHFIQLTEKLALHQIGQQNMVANVAAVKYITKKELAKRLRIARAFIFEHYADPITLDDIAQVACLSKYHLLRSYKQMFSTTPYQALLMRRIDKAKAMLARGNGIQDVGISCGFNDRRSFSRAFKQTTGYTPSTFQLYSGISN